MSQRKNGKPDPQLLEALKQSILTDLAKPRRFQVERRLKLADGCIDPRKPSDGPVALYLDWVTDPNSPELMRPYAALRFGHPDPADDFRHMKQPAVMCHTVQELQVLLTCHQSHDLVRRLLATMTEVITTAGLDEEPSAPCHALVSEARQYLTDLDELMQERPPEPQPEPARLVTPDGNPA
jgi:hypothetical protein